MQYTTRNDNTMCSATVQYLLESNCENIRLLIQNYWNRSDIETIFTFPTASQYQNFTAAFYSNVDPKKERLTSVWLCLPERDRYCKTEIESESGITLAANEWRDVERAKYTVIITCSEACGGSMDHGRIFRRRREKRLTFYKWCYSEAGWHIQRAGKERWLRSLVCKSEVI